mmetsp:Transcript_43348/g.104765  ORF Transcript_43348/g.104765 Transcript_43348/m.104765 type:complete len:195 (+) Transcript_43348:522-1106(+)
MFTLPKSRTNTRLEFLYLHRMVEYRCMTTRTCAFCRGRCMVNWNAGLWTLRERRRMQWTVGNRDGGVGSVTFFHRENATMQALPKGTKRAYKNHVDHLKAPQVTALYPYEGNLHEFVAGPQGAAVLDVLLPPYDNMQNRDCTFYEIRQTDPGRKPSGKEPCYVVPTGQPEDFHCISGRYGDLGEDDHQDMDYSI